MNKFIKIKARTVYLGELGEEQDYLINTDKIFSGDFKDKRLWLRGIGEYQLNDKNWAKLIKELLPTVQNKRHTKLATPPKSKPITKP